MSLKIDQLYLKCDMVHKMSSALTQEIMITDLHISVGVEFMNRTTTHSGIPGNQTPT